MECELCIQASKWRIAGVVGLGVSASALGVSALDLAAGLGAAGDGPRGREPGSRAAARFFEVRCAHNE